jgi:cell fate regulator YaaT (PSP1 superfamily)
MPLVVGVSFRKVGKVYYFDPGDLQLNEGDYVIAETARGIEFGYVMVSPKSVTEEELVAPLKKIVRVASSQDVDRENANREKEHTAYEVCQKKILEHNLPMKLLEAEYTFDGSQVTFSFSAENRVDFRELVKDVAGALKTKVQLHQIGVRDEAKLIGGYGTCGRSLCCSTFLSNFEPVSMKMAKDQSLFLNPTKFSGVCGKLMCCLRYEHDYYKDMKERFPSVGAIIPTPKGQGKVVDANVVSCKLMVELEGEVLVEFHMEELDLNGCCRKHGIVCGMREQNCKRLRIGDEPEENSGNGKSHDSEDEDIDIDIDIDVDVEDLTE